MSKSQFNIKIDSDLLTRVKRHAMRSGKSLTEYITDLVTKALSENLLEDDCFTYESQIKDIKDRILTLESLVSNREYLNDNFKPFTNSEAINCTKYMRGVFDNELRKRTFSDKKEAFNDLLNNINDYARLSDLYRSRLEEIMLKDNAIPFTGKELNDLSLNVKCNCPIRKGLINWTGNINIPSQQEICDRGENLLILV